MSFTHKIASKTFDTKSNTLKATWKVEVQNGQVSTDTKSDLIAIDDSSPIKWRLGLKTNPKEIYLQLEEGRELDFMYNVSSHRRYPDGEVYENFVFPEFKGPKCRCCGNFRIESIFVDLEIIYPMEAIKPIRIKPEIGVFRIPKESRNLFCDVKFLLEGEEVEAHRNLLAIKSPVFMKMFTVDTKDAKLTEPVEIKEATHAGFDQFLDLLYGLENPTDPNISLENMTLAERYEVEDVKKYVEYILVDSIKNDNVIAILIAADMNRAEKVKDAALKFLKKNPVEEMPDFDQLMAPTHTDLMKEILKNIRK